jgi:photosystem II stability/assembly factor-like uncharacterized protein
LCLADDSRIVATLFAHSFDHPEDVMNAPSRSRSAWPVRAALSLLPALVLLVATAGRLDAQQVGRWDIVDSGWVFFDAIDAADSLHFALIETMNDTDPPHIGERVRTSDDGGLSWRVALLDTTSTFQFREIAHPSPEVIVVLAVHDTVVDIPNGWMVYGVEWKTFATTDRGSTWHTTVTREPRFGLSMVDATHGFMLDGGLEDSLVSTSDGGITWSARSLGRDIGNVWGFHAIDESTYASVVSDSASNAYFVTLTTDAGDTWSTHALPPGGHNVTFVDAATIFATGGRDALGRYRSLVYRSTDAGATWSPVLDRETAFWGLAGAAFADAMNGIAYGSTEALFRTTDGGDSWRQEFLPWAVGIYQGTRDLAYPSKNVAVALLGSERIVRYDGEYNLARPTITEPSRDRDQLPIETRLAWTPIDGATSYDLQVVESLRSDDTYDPGLYAGPYIDDSLLSEAGRDITLHYNRRYMARARARNATQVSDWSSDFFFLSLKSATQLPHPSFLRPSAISGVPVEFEWTPVPGATAYDFQLSADRFFSSLIRKDTGLTGVTHVVPGLVHGEEFYAAVRARSGAAVSDWGYVAFTTEQIGAVERESSHAAPSLALEVAPNPVSARGQLTLAMTLTRAADVTIEIFRVDGARVGHRITRELGAGRVTLALRAPDLAPGDYIVRASDGVAVSSAALVIVP